MRGLYLNISKIERIYKVLTRLNIPYKKIEFPKELPDDGIIIYNPQEWEEYPCYYEKTEDFFIAIYGWFIYKNQKNCIKKFAEDFIRNHSEILDDIEGGIFIIYIHYKNQSYIINDLLSLSMHFFDDSKEEFIIAPSPYFFENKQKDELLTNILLKQNHLFGNYTIYKNIKRLEPGSIYFNSPNEFNKYYTIKSNKFDNVKLCEDIKRFSSFWDKKNKIIPMSGGLDSRLIFGCSDIDIGYSYGPPKCKDRIIANKFKNYFNILYGFSLLNINLYKEEKYEVSNLFEGIESNPLSGLLFAFRHIHNKFPENFADFDGFLGDVFQKGIYITFPGLKGNFYKTFPFLFYNKISEDKILHILKKRYKDLNNYELTMLLSDFHEKTDSLNINYLKKLTYYELYYGRGTRFIINGGIVMKSQFFTVAPAFCYRPILENLFSLNLVDSLRHKNIKKIWSIVNKNISTIRTDSLYNPLMNPIIGRSLKLLSKITDKTIPRKKGFRFELKNID